MLKTITMITKFILALTIVHVASSPVDQPEAITGSGHVLRTELYKESLKVLKSNALDLIIESIK
jgi:hypothetical protein